MVKVRNDLTGQIFNRLTVLYQSEDHVDKNGRHYAQWLCECSCDEHKQIIVRSSSLVSGNTQSCGCLHTEGLIRIGKNNKKTNEYDLSGEYGIGYCSNTGNEFYFDLEDYEKIKDYCWNEHILKGGYHTLEARDGDTKQLIRMQWLICGKNYDHINRNSLDNRKCNLRPASKNENNQNHKLFNTNTSGFSGVHFVERTGKWCARITVNNKRKHLGYFINKYDAVVARLKAELKYYGINFAPQRHLFKEYNIIME